VFEFAEFDSELEELLFVFIDATFEFAAGGWHAARNSRPPHKPNIMNALLARIFKISFVNLD
jgi:hypothetical protein